MFGNVLLWQSVAPFWFGFPTVMVAQLIFVGLAILTPLFVHASFFVPTAVPLMWIPTLA